LIGESEKVRTLRRARHRGEGRVTLYLGTEGCYSVVWIPVAQRGEKRGTTVNPIMNLG